MNKYFKDLTTIPLLLLYLYVCGILYYVSYWSTFDIDVSPFVQFQDIPKSFIYYNLEGILGDGILFGLLMYYGFFFNISILNYFKNNYVLSKFMYYGTSLLCFLRLASSYWHTNIFNYLSAVIATLMVVICLIYYNNIINFIKTKLTSYLLIYLIFIPCFVYIRTKFRSTEVYKNTTTSTIKIYTKDSTIQASKIPLKLLDYVGDKVIVSSLDNKQKFILNQSSLAGIELIDSVIKK